jgi:hypothetical protein
MKIFRIKAHIIKTLTISILSATLFFLPNTCKAQDYLPDGVASTASFLDELEKNYADENAILFDMNSITNTAVLPIRVNIIKTIKGKSGVSENEIKTGIDNANLFFQNIGIQFIIDTINYINDYNYGYITYNHNRQELITLYAKANRINLFMADSINMDSINCYGFTYFPNEPDSNYIFLVKSYATNNNLACMLGHFMGLLSTHDSRAERENADEKNCSTAGDLICDTYADPDLYNLVDTACLYTGSLKDSKGKYYVPTVANVMSNSPDNCKCKFTPLQYRRMYYYFKKYRQNLKK